LEPKAFRRGQDDDSEDSPLNPAPREPASAIEAPVAAAQITATEPATPGPILGLTPSLGFTTVSYTQTNGSPFSESAFYGELSYAHSIFIDDLGFQAKALFTLLPFSSNQNGVTARYLEFNLDASYHLPWIKTPWSLSILVGGFYSTMLVTNNAFGYTSLLAPEIFPVLKRMLTEKDGLSAYFKFVPLGAGIFNFGFNQRQLEMGLFYERTLANSHSLNAGLDFSDLVYNPAPATTITSEALTLKLGYQF
jgi:hypothetical protein